MKRLLYLSLILALLSASLTACQRSKPTQLGDYAWRDADADGIQDPEEEGLQGVKVRLYNSAGALVAQTESDDEGLYGFAEVSSGDYYLEFVPPERYYDEFETETIVTFRLTLKDQGTSDLADSDVNPDTRRTDIFSFDAAAKDLSRDAGFVPLTEEITPTPTIPASPTPEDNNGGGNGGGDNGGKKVVNIPAADDAFVATNKPDASTGSEETFFVWGNNNYVYLRFSLADIPAGTQIPYAKLHLKIHPNSTAQGLKIWIRMVSPNYTWTQTDLTWNNAPSPDPDAPALLDAALSAFNGEDSEDIFDVTALVQYAIDHGYTNFEIVIGTSGMSDEHSQEWYSSESGKGPVLEVDP